MDHRTDDHCLAQGDLCFFLALCRPTIFVVSLVNGAESTRTGFSNSWVSAQRSRIICSATERHAILGWEREVLSSSSPDIDRQVRQITILSLEGRWVDPVSPSQIARLGVSGFMPVCYADGFVLSFPASRAMHQRARGIIPLPSGPMDFWKASRSLEFSSLASAPVISARSLI